MANKTSPAPGRVASWVLLVLCGGASWSLSVAHAVSQPNGPHAWIGALVGTLPVFCVAILSHMASHGSADNWERALVWLVMILSFSMSLSAQAATVDPYMDEGLNWVFPVMSDVATIVGLRRLMRTATPVRTEPVQEAVRMTRTGAISVRTEGPAEPVREDRTGTTLARTGAPTVRTETAPEPVRSDRTDDVQPCIPSSPARTDSVRVSRTDATQARTEGPASPVRPLRTDDDSTRTARTETAPEPVRSDRTDDVQPRTEEAPEPVRVETPSPVPAARTESVREDRTDLDRAEVVTGLAAEIVAHGATWRPDYAALMTSTGRGRSWCEKVVRDARSAAELMAPTAPGRAS